MTARKPRASTEPSGPEAASAPALALKISLERARELLGVEAVGLSDIDVARICRELYDYAMLLIRMDARQQEVKASVELAEETLPLASGGGMGGLTEPEAPCPLLAGARQPRAQRRKKS